MNEIFKENGCIKLDSFLDEQTTNTFAAYFTNKVRRGEWTSSSKDIWSKWAYYADPLAEVLLAGAKNRVAEILDLQLEPTYTYARIYQENEDLPPHKDRDSCEISLTISIAYVGEVWPFWVQYKDKDPMKFMLNPGDAVLYQGCEASHWRHVLPVGASAMQIMLHYVDKNGSNLSNKLDVRPDLGYPSSRLDL